MKAVICASIVAMFFVGAADAADSIASGIAAGFAACEKQFDLERFECAGAIVQTGSRYRVAGPVQGSQDSFRLAIAVGPHERVAALFHTHRGDDNQTELISDNDVAQADDLDIPSFVFIVTSGNLRVYVPHESILISPYWRASRPASMGFVIHHHYSPQKPPHPASGVGSLEEVSRTLDKN